MTDKQVMIEDYIPVDAISIESVREKLGGHHISRGMPRNLHLWWARRPLAACRAAVYATFAPPAKGKKEREALPEFFRDLCHWTGPVLAENEAIKKARMVVSTAAGGKRPVVLDMFAGGGAIPLEALRLGADAIAVELNPVAHLIQLCTLVYPEKYGKRLRDAVAEWGEWVIARTQEDIGDLYADIPLGTKGPRQRGLAGIDAGEDVLRPIAYLWTRTIPSPARGCEKGMVPLVRQTWLRKKTGNFVAARPIVDRKNLTVRYQVVESSAKTEAAAIEEWGFDPAGMSVRGATTCPFTGNPVTAADAKVAGMAGKMGALLMAVACVRGGKRGKVYVGPDALDGLLVPEEAVAKRVEGLCAETGLSVPDEPLPEKLTGGMCSIYGLDSFGKLFTPRQQLLLLTLCKHVRLAHERVAAKTRDKAFPAAVASYLGLLVGRVANRCSTLCPWDTGAEKTAQTFGRQALPMVWDFSEANPFGGASGDARGQIDYILEVIDHVAQAAPDRQAQVIHGRAQRLPLPDASIEAVVTDPPYYDNISYADLSDFFYVWHKRALVSVHPGLYATLVTPKKPEAVVAPHRHHGDKEQAAAFYEDWKRSRLCAGSRSWKARGIGAFRSPGRVGVAFLASTIADA